LPDPRPTLTLRRRLLPPLDLVGLSTLCLSPSSSSTTDDNAAAGAAIKLVTDAAAQKAKVIFVEAQKKIDAQTLTLAEAEAYFKQLEDILMKVRTDVKPEVAKLSPAVQIKVLNVFTTAFSKSQAIAKEIYALLRMMNILAIDYSAVKARVFDIKKIVEAKLLEVVELAFNNDADIGTSIGLIFNDAVQEAKVFFVEAEKLIDDKTLTLAQAQKYFQKLEVILQKAQDDVKPMVAKLNAAVQNKIKETFTTALSQAKVIVEEIYTLLRVMNIFA